MARQPVIAQYQRQYNRHSGNMEQLQAALSAQIASSADSGAVQALLAQLATIVEPLDVHISSPGGVGSTTLSNFLNRHGFTTNLLLDTDGTRHTNRPPAWSCPDDPSRPHPGKPRTVVYLYGDPTHVVCSHYRRGQAHHQALKTSGGRAGPVSQFPPTAEAYFVQGQDLFGLLEHFRAWRAGADAYDIVLLKYEAMFEPEVAWELFRLAIGHKRDARHLNELCGEWLQLKGVRSSQAPDQAGASGLYKDVQREMAAMPGLLVIPARGAWNF